MTIIRAGSERQQGVAYLPDGTMIVIEDTAKMIDKTVRVEVAKVLQTSAGRMIFADLVKK
ncbi:twitching motility protein pilT [Lactococcus termiticola]|uniref:Twitching motility protein pilT n=1 Tax=Lactococcus termiticola TaxID=2169526 RepID=A0A2R5HI62_9LACT|nr:twitching motility protein pilT [Lactococcus termiticola]